MTSKKQRLFERAVIAADAATRALPGYTGRAFGKMMADCGPYGAAQRLLAPYRRGQVQEGFVDLFLLRRIDMSVKWLAIQPEWESLFTAARR